MKKLILLQTVCLLAFVSIFTSCKKDDFNEEDLNEQIVIDGAITNLPGAYTIKVKKIDPDRNNLPPVKNAVVTISDNAGNIDRLVEVTPGVYQTTTIRGVEGRTYTLVVNIAGKEYQAISTMPHSVPLNNIIVEETTQLGKKVKAVEASFYDPEGESNYYLFSLVKNNKCCESEFIFNDGSAYDGREVSYNLPDTDKNPLKAGDHLEVIMYSIDCNQYKYLLNFQHKNSTYQQSNITNGALGHFGAQAVSSKNVIIS